MYKKILFIFTLISCALFNNNLYANTACMPSEVIEIYDQEIETNNNSQTSSK